MNRLGNRKVLYIIFSILIVCIFSITIAYSALSTLLDITGTAQVQGAKWDIHFDNVVVKYGSVLATKNPTIETPTTVDFSVTLNEPGDFFEFTIDVVNEGSIDAMIESIVKTPDLSPAQQKYLSYTITYNDGNPIGLKQLLKANKQKTLKVNLTYRKDLNNGELPTSPDTLNLSFQGVFSQADETNIIGSDGSGNVILERTPIPEGGIYLTNVPFTKYESSIEYLDWEDIFSAIYNNNNLQEILAQTTELEYFPLEPKQGDIYIYGEYVYQYDVIYYYDAKGYAYDFSQKGNEYFLYELGFEHSETGWNCSVNLALYENKESFGPPLEMIAGKPLRMMQTTYRYVDTLKIPPVIPASVKNMKEAFCGCENLEGTLDFSNIKDVYSSEALDSLPNRVNKHLTVLVNLPQEEIDELNSYGLQDNSNITWQRPQ